MNKGRCIHSTTGVENSKVTEGAYYTAMRWTIPPTPGVLALIALNASVLAVGTEPAARATAG